MVLWVVGHNDLTTPFSILDLARTLAAHPMPRSLQVWLFFAIATGFMIKVPLFLFHDGFRWPTSKPLTAGSVLLAGVLLKLGSYGFPSGSAFRHVPGRLRPCGAAADRPPRRGSGSSTGSLCALVQRGASRKLVAHGSVRPPRVLHAGALRPERRRDHQQHPGDDQPWSSTGPCSSSSGWFTTASPHPHARRPGRPRQQAAASIAVSMGTFISMASIGLPGLNGFVGEVLRSDGDVRVQRRLCRDRRGGAVLGARYLLTMVQHGFFGPLREPRNVHDPIEDIQFPRSGRPRSPKRLCACGSG